MGLLQPDSAVTDNLCLVTLLPTQYLPCIALPSLISHPAPSLTPVPLLFSQVLVVLAVGGWNSSSLQRPLFLAVRLASWNQILDPWVYILLRQAVLRQLLRLLPLRAGAKGGPTELDLTKSAWEASSLRSSRHSGFSHL